MNLTFQLLIAAILVVVVAAGCGDPPTAPEPVVAGDSVSGHDLALAPLHYVDADGHLYELLIAVGPDGRLAAALFVRDGAPFATVAVAPGGTDADVQLYDRGAAAFRAVVSFQAAAGDGEPWPAFASAAAEALSALALWQHSASAGALGRLHAASSTLAAAAARLLAGWTGRAN